MRPLLRDSASRGANASRPTRQPPGRSRRGGDRREADSLALPARRRSTVGRSVMSDLRLRRVRTPTGHPPTSVLQGVMRRVSRMEAAEVLARTSSPLLIVPVAMLLWISSVSAVDVSSLDDYGLPPALPVTWYLALALLIGGALAALHADTPRPLVVALYAAAIVLVLYGTVPLLTKVPQYTWTYKHIGVTRYFESHGHDDPSLDIYHHWPGF